MDVWYFGNLASVMCVQQGCAPRPVPPRGEKGSLASPRKKQVLPQPAPPHENWQNLRAGQSWTKIFTFAYGQGRGG